MSDQNQNLAGYVLGAYDPFSSSIRLPFDISSSRNLLDNPTLVHELAHYGQTVLTEFGSDYAMILHELYYATSHILRTESELRLPLNKTPAEKRISEFWEHSAFVQQFVREAVGGLSTHQLLDFGNKVKSHPHDLFPAVYEVGGANPIWLTGIVEREHLPRPLTRLIFSEDGHIHRTILEESKYKHPTLEVEFQDGQHFSFVLDGSFVMEFHARLVEFINYLITNSLEPNEQVEYFLFSQNNPYLLPTLAVERLLVQRLGTGSVIDAAFLSHLCCVIALNWTSSELTDIPAQEIGTQHIRLQYIPPGQLFARALSAALEHLTYHGQAIDKYFSLFRGVLRTLGAGSFESITDALIAKVERFAGSIHPSPGTYEEFLVNRWMDTKRAVDWWKRSYVAERWDAFVRAPLILLADKVISGPIILGPERLSTIWGSPAPPGQIRAMIYSLLSRKLWSGADLTCMETDDQPFAGSVLGCAEEFRCPTAKLANSGLKVCVNPLWEKALTLYGLATEIADGPG
jgi:hypothetical protein